MAPNVSDSDRAAGTVWQRAKGRPQDTINDQNNNDACQSGSSSNHCDQGASVPPTPFRARIRWPDLFAQLFVHGGFLIGLYYLVTFQAKFYTYLWSKRSCVCLLTLIHICTNPFGFVFFCFQP